MIYILTPHMYDFRNMCLDNKLPYSNGRSTNDVIWINQVQLLYGRKIFKDDKIIYGEKYYDFSGEEVKRFEVEIALRSHNI
jgi:hypothetical protein